MEAAHRLTRGVRHIHHIYIYIISYTGIHVEIGKVVNSSWGNVPLETVFADMRETLRGELAQRDVIKEEDFEFVRVPIDSLRYTQDSNAMIGK